MAGCFPLYEKSAGAVQATSARPSQGSDVDALNIEESRLTKNAGSEPPTPKFPPLLNTSGADRLAQRMNLNRGQYTINALPVIIRPVT